MLALTAQQTRDLAGLLETARRTTQEHAATESYRATACRAIKDRTLARWHQQRHDDAVQFAADLDTAAEWLRTQQQRSRITALR